MRTLRLVTLCALILLGSNTFAQKTVAPIEKFGNTLNLGIGLAITGMWGTLFPLFMPTLSLIS